MARPYPSSIKQPSSGNLLIEECHPGFNQVYFIPPKEKLEDSGLDTKSPESFKKHILDISDQNDFISIYPINTLAGHNDFLDKKYDFLESITITGFGLGFAENSDEVVDILENLPSAFVKDYDFGLGLNKDYRFIIHFLEEYGFKHLVISKEEKTSISRKTYTCTLSYPEFEIIRKKLNTITRHAQTSAKRIKYISTNNLMSAFLKSDEFPIKSLEVKNATLEKLIVGNSSELSIELTNLEQKEAVALIDKNKTVIAKDNPEILMKLQNDIELVTLEKLIEKFEEMLKMKRNENHWQQLFNDNPFILNMAFGYPVIKIQDQASIGGRKLSGDGDKITDFIVKNSITNNTALFEIKTPQTKLLNKTMYRDSVYTPSSDMSGSINQVLDQKYKFQKEISNIKDSTRIYDVETYAVHCSLIIGLTPEGLDQQKSFELFRKNSKSVDIVTFDELLEKLKQLFSFLSN